ncbi:LysR family transcriptional regulator [Thalassobius sp. I31.1]|uniref:LysR family transcriptional regulator n=1 Tax=Thalassobius sp. I31.1 TaxID=2109912 RepID=UPI000D1B6331|nr:LysR family transcriptional regulator [Thalassobius sp. I31.1]
MDWDDLRAFLAVAQRCNLRQAADMLGVTQPTIARRLKRLETGLGVPLFERSRDGHQLTEAGAQLLPDVRAVESVALRVEQRSLGLLEGLTETVRVEAGEWAAAVIVQGLHNLSDGPQIELVLSGTPSPATDRSPDLSLHHGLPGSGNELTRRIGAIECAFYGAPKFLQGQAAPLSDSELSALPWLGFVEEQENYVTMRWLQHFMKGRRPAARMMNTDLMLAATSSGFGAAVLPCFVADQVQGIVRLSSTIKELRADYWIKINPDLAQNPSIRLVALWITECFRAVRMAPEQDKNP